MNLRNALLFVVVGLSCSAFAQKADSFDYRIANLFLLQDRTLQKKLGVTEAQRNKMNVYAGQHQQRVAALQKGLGTKPTKAQAEAAQKQASASVAELKKLVFAQLSASQIRGLRIATLQAVGVPSLADEVVADKVGLTAAQLKKVRSTLGGGRQRIATIERDAAKQALKPYEGRKPKTKAETETLQKEAGGKLRAAGQRIAPELKREMQQTDAKILAILTPKQLAVWKGLISK